ncbi:hypothetical protein GCM10010912_08540 [Paenibacillus albidus]|uniref:Helix-turn-helix domain-containing protein n=1 Tax=Paenibacillus albidus TaxID=2041023 RepID=A0A917FBQ8_9BACL|nr:helix-turn-helix domain-containing protein [Paenibacillus albidus]GGF65779.1 hypothetical protein GCM10010912_08540 [Paenibacillus albidus]
MTTGPKTLPIEVTPEQQHILERYIGRRKTPQYLAKRARLVLEAKAGLSNSEISRRLPLDRTQVVMWRKRWVERYPGLCRIEQEPPNELEASILQALRDEPHPGHPSTFSAEQVVQIVAIASVDPKDCGRPISHWTPREVRDEVLKRGIVPSISVTQVGRFLK